MLLLVQFLFRLSFGMAAAMAVTSPRLVTSGYYRNNAYVLLGMNVLAALAAWSGAVDATLVPPWIATTAAAASYVAAVCWLYEKPRAGTAALVVIAVLGLVGAVWATPVSGKPADAVWLCRADAAASGLLLGITMAAMLLGHWYLNAPGMKIAPLEKLNLLIGAAVVVRAVVCGLGLAGHLQTVEPVAFVQWLMIGLRWGAGILGTLGLVAMTRSTLKIPNTQAATGMLYVAVITTFLGELVGQLLSAANVYPL
jgi:hypothetical protein